jgi:hypothetical protein
MGASWDLSHNLRYVCRQLEKARNNGARVIINLPPRHLKNTVGNGLSGGMVAGVESGGKDHHRGVQ